EDQKKEMTYWHHKGIRAGSRIPVLGKWGKCHRDNHKVRTVGQMLEHAEGGLNHHEEDEELTEEESDDGEDDECRCKQCKNDSQKGCTNPSRCRNKALGDKWRPTLSTDEERDSD
ncbi:hypothetical protein DFP72DRAFT_776025, partial [Ephemerocybe angulata]